MVRDARRCRAPHHEGPLPLLIGEAADAAVSKKCSSCSKSCQRSRRQASVCTITGPAIAVAGPVNSGARSCSIHASARLFDSSAAA